MNRNFKILTYNILTGKYAKSGIYRECEPKYLYPKYRLQRLTDIFADFINQEYFICLQEVDLEISCKLQLYFKKNGYDFHYQSQGTISNDFMGLGIAVPSNTNITNIYKKRLSDFKDWPRQPKSTTTLISYLPITVQNYFGLNNKDLSQWYKMRNKVNFALTLEIDNEFYLTTVHIPCVYQYESSMITYVGMLLNHLGQLDGKHILVGDFNIQPDSEVYKLITEGKCSEVSLDNDYPDNDLWRPSNVNLLKLEDITSKIDYTTNCESNFYGNTNKFKGKLDYIFVSGFNYSCKHVDVLFNTTEELLHPNFANPSDHMPLSAEFDQIN